MNGPTHQLIGVTVIGGTALLAGIPYETAGVLATGSYLASKLPDLDQRIWGLRHRCALTHGVFVAAPLVTTIAAAGALGQPVPARDRADHRPRRRLPRAPRRRRLHRLRAHRLAAARQAPA
jgi:hypothetical protein